MILLKLQLSSLRRYPLSSSSSSPTIRTAVPNSTGGFGFRRLICSAAGNKVSARLAQVQQLLREAEERSGSASNEPPPTKMTIGHVSVSFARSGGPGGQNVNKVNTKVDMRFNVKNAHWLSDRIRDKIIQLEKNRINKDGEIVISSTKTRTQKGNIEDALSKLQAIIDAASYAPPPPSEEQKKKIEKLAAIGEQKRLKSKKAQSDKKAQEERLRPFPAPELPPVPDPETWATSSPFPTGRKTDLTTLCGPSSTTLLHRKLEQLLELAFLQTRTAPRWLSLASLNTLAKSLGCESTTKKSIPARSSITSSASPMMTSGAIPSVPMDSM